MGCMDHWHPVLPVNKLRQQPVAVSLNGKSLVLFRTGEGHIGVLDDQCPHRRMKLSKGKVTGDCLQCPYHGWTFTCQGKGQSPGTPKLYAQVPHYDAMEKFGVIWVKSAHSFPEFPDFDVKGYYHLATLHHSRVRAPLETTLDNFTEIEHTATTHALFGYELNRMQDVNVQVLPTKTTTRVVNIGPPKRLPWWDRLLLGIGKDWQFHDDWTSFFSPVYSVFDHWWTNPANGKESKVRWRIYIFFVPDDAEHTSLMTFIFTKSAYPGPAGGIRLFRGKIRRMMKHEIDLDIRTVENLADNSPHLEGMKLSRFDRVLGLNRERIERVYRGQNSRQSLVVSQ